MLQGTRRPGSLPQASLPPDPTASAAPEGGLVFRACLAFVVPEIHVAKGPAKDGLLEVGLALFGEHCL